MGTSDTAQRLFVTDQARPFAGCATECERVSSGRLRGGYHVRGPVVENMIAVATYWKFGRPNYGAHPFPASAEPPGALFGYVRRVRRAKNERWPGSFAFPIGS